MDTMIQMTDLWRLWEIVLLWEELGLLYLKLIMIEQYAQRTKVRKFFGNTKITQRVYPHFLQFARCFGRSASMKI
jgi:hypothetical protein